MQSPTENPAPTRQLPSGQLVRTGVLAVLTGLMFSVGPVTVDLSLPSMPAMQHAIGSAHARIEFTLTLLFFGLAASQFVVGAIADRYGRRTLILSGLAVYCAGAALAFFSATFVIFAAARLLQALGFGVAVMLIRSAVSDVCDHRRTASVFSTAVTMVSLASVIAPTIGGQLLTHFGWRSVFLGMAAFGLLTLCAVAAWLPETLPRARRTDGSFSRVFGTYGRLLRDRRFVAFAVVGAAAAAYQFTYNTGAPSVLIEHYHLPVQTTGLLFSVIAVSTACASQLSAFLLKWFDPDRIMNTAVIVSVITSAALVASAFTGLGGVPALIASLFVVISTIGFIMGNSMAGAMSSGGAHAGAASALVGVMQFLFGTIGSALVGFFPDILGRPMATVIGLFSALALCMVLLVRPTVSQSFAGAP
jgi:MFS transporter, DHA1 family, multidrug resistance protein